MIEILERPFTPDEAHGVACWAYDEPFDFYDLSGDDVISMLLSRDEAGHGYYPLQADGDVVGFLCFGPEARVRGQSAESGTCDIGAGLRPDRLSRGLATQVMPLAIAFAVQRFGALRLRAAVAAFNERSLRLCTSAGFQRLRDFDGPRETTFVELALEIRSFRNATAGLFP